MFDPWNSTQRTFPWFDHQSWCIKTSFPGDIEQYLYTLRGIRFPISKLASEGYVISHNKFSK